MLVLPGVDHVAETSETSQETLANPDPKDGKAVGQDVCLDLAVPSSTSASSSSAKLTIFSKVLEKKSSGPSSPTLSTKKQHKRLDENKSNALVKVSGSASEKSLALQNDEKMELKTWMEKAVLETGKKKQQKKKPKKRRPAASRNKTKKKTDSSTDASPEQMPKKRKQLQASHKSSFKHRKTSTAYHSAKCRALKEGKSKQEAAAALQLLAEQLLQKCPRKSKRES